MNLLLKFHEFAAKLNFQMIHQLRWAELLMHTQTHAMHVLEYGFLVRIDQKWVWGGGLLVYSMFFVYF